MTGSLTELLGTGGPIIAILAVLSVVSLALIVSKTLQLWSVKGDQGQREAAFELWSKGDRGGAAALLEKGRAPADRVASYAMRQLARGMDRGALEMEAMRRGNEEVERLTRNIRLIEVIAIISPLLGLLGTVLGMIQSFQELELAQGSANASVLAGGIWQALLTTAAGLIAAIPAAVGANLLSARIERAGHLIENSVQRLLAMEGDTGSPAAKVAAAPAG